MKKAPTLHVEEISGERFVSLKAAQDAARAYIVSDLADILRKMFESGLLEIKDGRITPKVKRDGI